MLFSPTDIDGLWALSIERHADERGSFGRTFDAEAFADRDLVSTFAQSSTSLSLRAGTLRGMHLQREPHAEVKLVRCVRGAIYDVVADLRPRSPTYRRWQGFTLRAHDDVMLYIPTGCAHGFQTLSDDTEVTYDISVPYAPGYADGFRFDDPAFAIAWPLPPTIIAEKDLAWPAHIESRVP